MRIIHFSLAVAALAMGASSDPSSSSPPAPSQASVSAQTWNIQYSPGMSAHPIAVAGGWYFDFPAPSCGSAQVCSVHYVSTPVQMSVTTGGHVNAVFEVTTRHARLQLPAQPGQHLQLSRTCKILSTAHR
jgi:hypothetical protein